MREFTVEIDNGVEASKLAVPFAIDSKMSSLSIWPSASEKTTRTWVLVSLKLVETILEATLSKRFNSKVVLEATFPARSKREFSANDKLRTSFPSATPFKGIPRSTLVLLTLIDEGLEDASVAVPPSIVIRKSFVSNST